MGEFDNKRIQLARSLTTRLAGDDNLPVEFARLMSRGLLRDWEAGELIWQPEWSSNGLREAMRLVRAAETLDFLGSSLEAAKGWRRAGELLEWLSRAEDSLRNTIPIGLLAGAAFQLGQLPAMANSLLSREEVANWEAPIHAAFIRGDFAEVLDQAAEFWTSVPELVHITESTDLFQNDPVDIVMNELVRCLGLIAGGIRHGNRSRIDIGTEKLETIARWSSRTASYETSLLIRLEAAVANRFVDSSLQLSLQNLAQTTSTMLPPLNAISRGLLAEGRSLLWPSQIRGIQRIASGESFVLCSPTGSGKTLVAVLTAAVELFDSSTPEESGQAPLVLYLVSSRALAMEAEATLSIRLRHTGAQVSALYGGVEWSGDTDFGSEFPQVIVSTVEKAEALLRYAPVDIIRRLRLLVVDEAQQAFIRSADDFRLQSLASGEDRSLRLEAFVARLLARRPDIRRIAVSAVVQGADRILAKWFGGEESEPASPQLRSKRQLIGSLELRKADYQFIADLYNGAVLDNEAERFLPLRIPALPNSPKVLHSSEYVIAQASSLWVAGHLASRGKRVLLSVGSHIQQMQDKCVKALKSLAWKTSIPATYFHPPVEGDRHYQLWLDAVEACRSFCGSTSHELILLERGVVSHHGQLPHIVRKLFTQLIRVGIARVVLATSTLSEGVNLPFDMVILPLAGRKIYDHTQQSIAYVPFNSSEFLNLAGRAGRPGTKFSMEGITAVCLPKKPSAHAKGVIPSQRRNLWDLYNSVIRRVIESEKQDIHSPLQLLINRLSELATEIGVDEKSLPEWLESVTIGDLENPVAAVLDNYDHLLLNAIVEVEELTQSELSLDQVEIHLKALWEKSLATVMVTEEARLEQLILIRGRALWEREYPERAERRLLYMLGLPPHAGKSFTATATALESLLEGGNEYGALEANEKGAYLAEIVDMVRQDTSLGFKPPLTATDEKIQRAWKDVLQWWLGLKQHGPSPSKLRNWMRFIQNQFDHRTGMAVGGTLAAVWDRTGITNAPTPESWAKETSLPWISYWCRDLLRWGTVEPMVAYLLSRGRIVSREGGDVYVSEFNSWKTANGYSDPEDSINPQLIAAWYSERFDWDESAHKGLSTPPASKVSFTPDPPFQGIQESLMAWPMTVDSNTWWMEPAGYRIGISDGILDLDAHGRRRCLFEALPKDGLVTWGYPP